MGQVLIRNVPDDVIEAHRRRAKALGHSLEQELRTLIECGGGLLGRREARHRRMGAKSDAARPADGRGRL